MTDLPQTLAVGAMLALIHAAIPNHWVPIVVLGRTYAWRRGKVLRIAAFCGGAHVASTIGIGVAVALVGRELGERYEAFGLYAAPVILTGLGLVLILLDLTGKSHHHGHCHGPMDHHDPEHDHHHGDQHPDHDEARPAPDARGAIAGVTMAMFLSPCLELEVPFLQVGKHGWTGILGLSVTYMLVTVTGIITLVLLFSAGYQRVRWHFLEYHERLVSGVVLVAAGILAYALHAHGH